MRLRWLAAYPLLYAVLFAALSWSLLGGDALAPFVTWQRLLVRVLAAAGCFAAVSCFERGDHLRRAWLALGGGTVVIFLRDVLRLFSTGEVDSFMQAALTGLGILSNLALLAGVWLLARSWRMASIALPGGRSGVLAVTVVTAALALLVAGPSAVKQAQALSAGDPGALVLLVSAVVDILSLCLITPLLLTAVALRGSLFSWPWVLVTGSQLSWLLYDAAVGVPPGWLPAGFPLPDVFRGLAGNFLFAAGLAQLLVIRQVRGGIRSADRQADEQAA